MNQVIERFAVECYGILKKDPGADGLEQVSQRLEKIVVNEDVIKEYFGPD